MRDNFSKISYRIISYVMIFVITCVFVVSSLGVPSFAAAEDQEDNPYGVEVSATTITVNGYTMSRNITIPFSNTDEFRNMNLEMSTYSNDKWFSYWYSPSVNKVFVVSSLDTKRNGNSYYLYPTSFYNGLFYTTYNSQYYSPILISSFDLVSGSLDPFCFYHYNSGNTSLNPLKPTMYNYNIVSDTQYTYNGVYMGNYNNAAYYKLPLDLTCIFANYDIPGYYEVNNSSYFLPEPLFDYTYVFYRESTSQYRFVSTTSPLKFTFIGTSVIMSALDDNGGYFNYLSGYSYNGLDWSYFSSIDYPQYITSNTSTATWFTSKTYDSSTQTIVPFKELTNLIYYDLNGDSSGSSSKDKLVLPDKTKVYPTQSDEVLPLTSSRGDMFATYVVYVDILDSDVTGPSDDPPLYLFLTYDYVYEVVFETASGRIMCFSNREYHVGSSYSDFNLLGMNTDMYLFLVNYFLHDGSATCTRCEKTSSVKGALRSIYFETQNTSSYLSAIHTDLFNDFSLVVEGLNRIDSQLEIVSSSLKNLDKIYKRLGDLSSKLDLLIEAVSLSGDPINLDVLESNIIKIANRIGEDSFSGATNNYLKHILEELQGIDFNLTIPDITIPDINIPDLPGTDMTTTNSYLSSISGKLDRIISKMGSSGDSDPELPDDDYNYDYFDDDVDLNKFLSDYKDSLDSVFPRITAFSELAESLYFVRNFVDDIATVDSTILLVLTLGITFNVADAIIRRGE